MSHLIVGQTFTALQLVTLPTGVEVRRTQDGNWEVTAIPETYPLHTLAVELWNAAHPEMDVMSLDDLSDFGTEGGNRSAYLRLAAHVSDQFTRKPVVLVDRHGDKWELVGPDSYSMRNGVDGRVYVGDREFSEQSRAEIEQNYGPVREQQG